MCDYLALRSLRSVFLLMVVISVTGRGKYCEDKRRKKREDGRKERIGGRRGWVKEEDG